MKLNSSQLDAFFAVARLLNFTKAAEQLNVTQSALSQRIAKLEEELGTTLFIRDRISIRITEAGEQVLRYCQLSRSAESELLGKLKDSKDGLAGVIRVGGFSSINRSLVIPALKDMMLKNPKLSIQLVTKEIQDLQLLLQSGEAEYIITDKRSESPDIESIFLGFEEYVLVKKRSGSTPEIFLDHDERDPTTKAYFSKHKISFKPLNIRYLDDVYGLIDGVKNGYGKAILPLHLIENETSLEVVDPKRFLKVSVYLQHFIQPFYRTAHSILIEEIRSFFESKLCQEK